MHRPPQIELSNAKCLTQTRSPKHSLNQSHMLRQITALMKNTKDRQTDRNTLKPHQMIQHVQKLHQTSTTSRPSEPRNTSLTFHQLLQEYRNHKTLNKENSLSKANKHKVRQISFPNTLPTTIPLNPSNSRTRIKDSLYQTKTQILSKISNIAVAQQGQLNYCLDNLEGFQNSINQMCRLSQEQLDLLNQAKEELAKPDQAFRKSTQRCVSADIQLPLKSPQRKSRSNSQDFRNCGSTQANSNPKDIDLTCDEQTIVINSDEQRGTQIIEVDPLIQLERQYLPDPYYLNSQEEITWLMRAILIDWIMEVCLEFQLKRQTFHLAVCYLDGYLSKKQATKLNLQLIGLTGLFIAAKIEEIIPRKVADFERAADFGYSSDQILEMELNLFTTMKWFVNPPTYTYWVNWFTDQWDIYASTKGLHQQFRKPTEESYQMFRKLTQLIDCSLMDIQTLQYLPRTIVASNMYLILCFEMDVFQLDMLSVMAKTSLFLLDQHNGFNQLYGEFVKTAFGFALQDLLPAIQYSVNFYGLEINYETPPGVASLGNTHLENHYEEFLSFQCYSKSNLQLIRSRPRE